MMLYYECVHTTCHAVGTALQALSLCVGIAAVEPCFTGLTFVNFTHDTAFDDTVETHDQWMHVLDFEWGNIATGRLDWGVSTAKAFAS